MRNFTLLLFISVCLFVTSSCDEEQAPFEHPLQALEANIGVLQWVDIEGMKCRDGSDTGIGVKIQNPKKLMIYINGGGACFNEATCAGNPDNFNEDSLSDLIANFGEPGIFNAEDERNPVKDWSVIFIPYCTGDVHSGTRHNGQALGVPGQQKYVGAFNFQKVMEYVAPYFLNEGVEEVLLFGLSAGGYGVYVNFLETVNAFPETKIHVINDSGPLFSEGEAFPSCLQWGFVSIFGLPVPEELGTCCQPNIGLANVFEYSAQEFPNSNFGFMSSYEDRTSRFFLSFGVDNCQGAEGNIMPKEIFRNGLVELKENVLKPNNWSSFYLEDNSHTMLVSNDIYYEREVEGMYLYEWVDRFLKGEELHVSE